MGKKVRIKVKPLPHQSDALRFMMTRSAGLVSYGTGTGKSLIQAIGGMKLCSMDAVTKTVILATKGAVISLEECFEEHTTFEPEVIRDFDHLVQFYTTEGRGLCILQYETLLSPLRLNRYKIQLRSQFPADFFEKRAGITDGLVEGLQRRGRQYIITTFLTKAELSVCPEILEILKVAKCNDYHEGRLRWLQQAISAVPTAMFCDEVQKLINPNSGIGYLARLLRPLCPMFWGFTATPVMSKLDQLYKLMNLIVPDCLGTETWYKRTFMEFRRKRISKKKTGRNYVSELVGYKNLEKLRYVLSEFVISYYPEKDVKFIKKETTLNNWDEYDFIASGLLEEDGKDPSSSSFKMNALQQLVDSSPEKINLLLDSLAEVYDEGCVLFCFYHETISTLKEVLDNTPIDYRTLTGKQSKSAQKSAKNWFTEDSRRKVLMVSPAGGASFNLQSTPHMLIYDIPQAIGAFVQLIGRIVREGSDFDEFFIKMLVVSDTIDDYKFEYVSSNRDMVIKLFHNDTIPVGTFNGYNSIIMERLRDRMLWRK